MNLRALFGQPDTPPAPPVAVGPPPSEPDALRTATERHEAASRRVSKLRAKIAEARQRVADLADSRAALVRRAASGDDVRDQLREVSAASADAQAIAEGATMLLDDAEAEERTAQAERQSVAAPIAAEHRRRAIEAAEAAAREAADAVRSHYQALCAASGVLVQRLDTLADLDVNAAAAIAHHLDEAGDPLVELDRAGWRADRGSGRWGMQERVSLPLVPPPERPAE